MPADEVGRFIPLIIMAMAVPSGFRLAAVGRQASSLALDG